MEAYGFDWRTMTESECVAELFKLYQKLVEAENTSSELKGSDVGKPKKSRSSRKKVDSR